VAGTPFLGLPGNPAAVFVTFCLLCRPWFLKAQGADNYAPLSMTVPANFSVKKPGHRQEYLRARLVPGENAWRAEIYPNQSSGVLSSASWGNGLVELPVNTSVDVGDLVTFIPYDSFS
jgi:molybdopterin molybdotransferase